MSGDSSFQTAVYLQARFAIARDDLDEILGKLTQEKMNFAPKEGIRTVAGQLVEIAESELQILVGMMEAKIFTDLEAEQTFGDCNSLENLKKVLVETRKKNS